MGFVVVGAHFLLLSQLSRSGTEGTHREKEKSDDCAVSGGTVR